MVKVTMEIDLEVLGNRKPMVLFEDGPRQLVCPTFEFVALNWAVAQEKALGILSRHEEGYIKSMSIKKELGFVAPKQVDYVD